MLVDEQLCTGCEECLDYCCVDAIKMADGIAAIDLDLCVECSVCKRSGVCPTDAFIEQELAWPRSIRSIFSNPLTCFEATGVSGRGTEEMKTNEVTGRFGVDEAGVAIDIGRPNVGTSLADVEKLAIAAARGGLRFESLSPITMLMTDPATGTLQEEVKGERVLSAVIEGKVSPDRLVDVVRALREVEADVDTVFTVGVISRVGEDGRTILLRSLLESAGLMVRPNGKVNLGLGRPRAG
jgi:NAD-dependent dihydropyrimidine dehydrogenase PreA subunit